MWLKPHPVPSIYIISVTINFVPKSCKMSKLYSNMMAIANVLMVCAVLAIVAGQAPGDEQELCIVSLPALGENVVEDPPNGRILMDSSHYIRLLPPNSDPVWQEVDLDDNNPTEILASVSNSSDNNFIAKEL